MNFDESYKYLLSLGNEVLAMKLGLENIDKLLKTLDNPHEHFLKVQVAGTNGKGSTCAFLDAISRSAKIKTGLYTSPHLVSMTERIKINGAEINQIDFARHATTVRQVSEDLVKKGELEAVPTFFEQITAIALCAFAEAKIELGILETGLGGRFDATTAAKAEIVAITPIDYDHQNILGNTLTEIAAEKAAIIRHDTKVIVASQKDEAMRVIWQRCREMNVVPIVNNCRYFAEDLPEISFKTKNVIYPVVRLSLLGAHQNQNACVAISLAEVLNKDFGLPIFQVEIIEGLETAKHAGRLEWWFRKETGILFDGAHNKAGAEALRNYFLQEGRESAKITIVFGAMKDKDVSDIAEILFPFAEILILTKPDNPRSAEVEDLKEIAEKLINKSRIFLVPNVADAIDSAIQITSSFPVKNQSFICITGSLYLVGEAQKLLNESVLKS